MPDFFVSYNQADRSWAEWIAWQLEDAGFSTVVQAWDFRPGANFVLEMQRAATAAERTIAVLSPDYLSALFTQPEWAAAFAQDPTGVHGTLLPVRVRPCDVEGLLRPLIYCDLADLTRCELAVISDDPAFLNLPWELLRDRTPGIGFLAPVLGGLYRQRSGHALREGREPEPGGPFRVLLAVARPYGERDVPFGTVARPIIEALEPLRPRVEVELLRPPTFAALAARLRDRPGHYHAVHFDGHGVFAPDHPGRIPRFAAREGYGHLVFEKADGSPDPVNSADLGQSLASCGVPLFVLNACQSAEEGGTAPYSSVAARLVAAGARGVLAMSYSVYASTAVRFMRRFYERLMDRVSLAEAVAAARLTLLADPERDSVVGPLDLRDWMVPVLYQQEAGYVPVSGDPGTGAAAGPAPGDRSSLQEVCPEGRFGFIGRDYDLLAIERALQDAGRPWALLQGIGGTGKTELAYGFGRWYAQTGGCPGGVFVTSFKEKADFGQVIGSTVGHGTDFSRLPDQAQWDALVSHLRDNPCLLIWDNLETATGYPTGSEPLAPAEEQAHLARFLQALRGGRSRVLLTTRKLQEDWLGVNYRLITVRGLNPRDAAQLARAVLATVGKRPEDFRDLPEYSDLLRLLGGHPRSLEAALPQLRHHTPGEIITALRDRVSRLGESLEDASLGYAFSQMSERTRRHLPFLGLFAGRVHAGTLGAFVAAGDDQQETYAAVVGEALDRGGWDAVLAEAANGGLLQPLGSGLFTMHPTLPPFLRRQLVAAVGEPGLERLDREFVAFFRAWAAHYSEDVRRAAPGAIQAVAIEEPNLLRALRLAAGREQWGAAQAIIQTLYDFYVVEGRTAEWRALRGGLLRTIGDKATADIDRDRADLWMFLRVNEANDALERNELAVAETIYLRILAYLLSLHDPSVDPQVAAAYHQLGMVAQERGQWEQAEAWYCKALEIRERLGPPPRLVNTLAQLGVFYRGRGRFSDGLASLLRAFQIAAPLQLPVVNRIMVDVARFLQLMGEDDFLKAWTEALPGQEPPLELLRTILKRLNGEEGAAP